MKRLWPAHALVVLFCLWLPAIVRPQDDGGASVAVSTPAFVLAGDVTNVPGEMVDLMRISEMRYHEGSNLLKSGESRRARAAFNSAVDMILRSDWDLDTQPILSRFLRDLIQKIQQDESRYLQPNEVFGEEVETAVVDELEKLDLIPIKIDPSLRNVVEADLANMKYDIPIILNDKVLQSLNYWLNRGRKFFVDGLIRSGRYQDMIQRIFREESIPLDVMYLAQVESLFKTNALSRTKNKGIWQFGRGTATRYGLKVDSRIDERSDPEKSTRAAARYLNDLYGMFKDWNLVLAAYNWGEGKVQRLIDRSGLNDFWDMMDLRRNFPQETQNHVPLIMASIILARNPEKYGLPAERDQPLSYDQLAVARPIDLRAAGNVIGVPVDMLKQLNPSLRGYGTPSDFQLRVPEGTSPHLLAKLAQLPPPKPEPVAARRHKVRPGETLNKIATRYGVSVEALRDANDLDSGRVRGGTWLTIPSTRGSSSTSHSSSRKPAAYTAGTKSGSQPRSGLSSQNRSGKLPASGQRTSASSLKTSARKSEAPIKVQQAARR
jgi:membrane-bound lytic murein transglycosylase D